jgi:hypothetical protein
MVHSLPSYISFIFGLTALVSIVWFAAATKSKTFIVVIVCWAILQTILGLSGVYQDTTAMPPKIMLLGVLPALITITITFLSRKGKLFIDNINLRTLTYFHSIRVPVEIVLLLLFKNGLVPINITFEGTNFDLFSGVTASVVAFFAFRSTVVNKKLLLVWNIICLLLLLNVVITAILAAPLPFQKIAFDQPNVAILYFPFNLLPAVVVPLVFFGHLVAIRQLIKHQPLKPNT